ncbi:MAG: DNA-3-methyladenine glycosylase family protein [Ignavibacteriales bacterium]
MTAPQPNAPDADLIRRAREHLANSDPALAALHAVTPEFEWRLRPAGFAGLVKMVVEQQVSVAAAASIWRRFEEGVGGEILPHRIMEFDEEGLKAFGLSRPKARYAREIAAAHLSGAVDFDDLHHLPDDEAIQRLTAIKGVGRWTAETYLMFCHGRLDVFPGGDVALQEAMRWADKAETRPTEKEAYARAESWRPYRGVAAHLLWRCYGGVKRGEIALG